MVPDDAAGDGVMRLFERQQGFACLARVAQTVTESLTLDAVLDCVVHAAMDLVAESSARIWVLEGDRLVLRAEAGTIGAPGPGRKTVIDVGEGLIGHVARLGAPLALADVLDDPRTVNVEWMRQQGVVSYIGLPLAVHGRLAGVLSLHVRRPHCFSPEEIQILDSFGTQAAIAINNARLFQEAQAGRRRAEALAHAVRTLTERLDVAAVGARVVASVEPLFGVPDAVLGRLDGEGTLAIVAVSPRLRGTEPQRLIALGQSLAVRAAGLGRPLAADGGIDASPAAEVVPFRAAAAAPLIARGKTVGVLLLGGGAARGVSEDDLTLLATFADHAALALENARLYEEARDAHDFLRSVAANSADAILTTDVLGRITFFSPGAEEMFGRPAAEVLGQPLQSYHAAGTDEVAAMFAQLRERGRIRNYETAIRARDGRRIDVSVSVSFLRDGRGRTLGVVAVIRDVSDRRWVEQELARHVMQIARLGQQAQVREAFIRNVIENLGEGLIVVDGDGRVVAWNRAMAALYETEADAAVGLRYAGLLEDLGPRLTDVVGRLLAGTMDAVELDGLEHRRSNGEHRVLTVKARLLRQEGAPSGAVLLVEDATEAVALTRAARQAEKMAALGTLCAGTAHEINNPIGIITSRVELMLADADLLGLPAAVRDDLVVVRRNAQRVAQITQGLLSFARQSPDRTAPVDLNDVVHDTVFLVMPQLAKQGIRVSVTLEPALSLLLGDANALQQVLLNLLTNSCEAMQDGGGEVRIETSRAPGRRDHIRMTVTDTGCGIPAEQLPRIFDPFHTTKTTGTGLGLSITDGIIRAHHGTVDVHSEVGNGTTFTLTFPAILTRRGGETPP